MENSIRIDDLGVPIIFAGWFQMICWNFNQKFQDDYCTDLDVAGRQ